MKTAALVPMRRQRTTINLRLPPLTKGGEGGFKILTSQLIFLNHFGATVDNNRLT